VHEEEIVLGRSALDEPGVERASEDGGDVLQPSRELGLEAAARIAIQESEDQIEEDDRQSHQERDPGGAFGALSWHGASRACAV
jgi:hypothetical protein